MKMDKLYSFIKCLKMDEQAFRFKDGFKRVIRFEENEIKRGLF